MEIEESDSDEETGDHHTVGGTTDGTTDGNIPLAPIPLPRTLTDAIPLPAPVNSFDDVFGSDEFHNKPLSNGDLTPFDLPLSPQSPTDFLVTEPPIEQPPAAGVDEFDQAIGKIPGSISATPATFSFDTTFDDNFDFASASNDTEFPPLPATEQKGKSPGNSLDGPFGTPATPSEPPVQPLINQSTTPVPTNNVPQFESSFEEVFSGFDSSTAAKSEDKPVAAAVQPQDGRSLPGSFPSSPPIQTSPKVAATPSRVVEVRPVSPPPRAVSPAPRVVSPKPRISSSSSKEVHEKAKETNVRHSKLSVSWPHS
jgi:epidermal growth factor receptor substrate 15